ncbi:MAG: low molecular weight protein-tyrosine-phosphatase, partial [Chitinophagaceae bacterium]
MKVLMVCLGNICRSTLAQGILEKKIQEHELDWEVDSAGTNGMWNEGYRPYRFSIQVAQQHDIDITTQQARQLLPQDIDLFDKIWVMDKQNYIDTKHIFKNHFQPQKISLILDILPHKKNQSIA